MPFYKIRFNHYKGDKIDLNKTRYSLPCRKLYVCYFIVLNCVISFPLLSQVLLTGKVIDNNGDPLLGASIIILGTNNGTISDINGNFELAAFPGDKIKCSYIGYSTFEFTMGNESEITIQLEEDNILLKELVIIGYGTASRKDVTGSVARISENEFVEGRNTDPLLQIQGKVAGVVIQQPGGDPNGELSVRIRGATSLEGQPPLLVIDGIAIDDFYRAINAINPADIASYDILKDASAAAIYGARGANGVIIITTKKGKKGKTSIEYQGYTTIDKAANQLEMLDGIQFREATADMDLMGIDQGANTDWQKEITRTGSTQSHTLSVLGGSEQISYRGSLGYLNQKGIILNNGRETVNSRIKIDQSVFENKLQIRYMLNSSWTQRNLLPDQTSTSLSRLGGSSIHDIASSYLPVWPLFESDGSYFRAPVFSPNPLFLLKEHYSEANERFFQSSAKADYELFKGIKIGALGSITSSSDTYDAFKPPFPGTNNLSIAQKSNQGKQVYTGDFHLNFNRSINKHSFDITGVYEYNKFVNDGFSVQAQGFLIPELLNNNLGTATSVLNDNIDSYKNEVRLISFLGRVIYSYDERYIFTVNFRRDGSSKFGPNNRWGNFPSFALAWRTSNESFLRDQNWLNLKLRMSYGFTGNQENLAPYQYQTLYEASGPYLYNGQFLQSYGVTQESNPDLKWEVRRSFNVGLDFSFWQDRMYGTLDIFSDETKDLIYNYGIPQPPFLTNQVTANAASATNKGIEISLGGQMIANQELTWSVSGNFSTIRNKITGLLGDFKGIPLTLSDRSYGFARAPSVAGAGPVTKLEIGYPAGVFFIPDFAGLDPAGNELFNNYDEEGQFMGTSTTFTEQDLIYIDPTADFSWGVTNNVSFKNFNFSFFIRGVQGQKVFANSLLSKGSLNYLPSTNVSISALENGFAGNPLPSTFWLRDASFARLENLTIGYQFEQLRGIEKLRIFLSGNNLLLITNYEGVDPEIRTEGSQRYIDAAYYPKTSGFTLGLDLSF